MLPLWKQEKNLAVVANGRDFLFRSTITATFYGQEYVNVIAESAKLLPENDDGRIFNIVLFVFINFYKGVQIFSNVFVAPNWPEKSGADLSFQKNIKILIKIQVQSAGINLKCIPLRFESFLECLGLFNFFLIFFYRLSMYLQYR